MSVRNITYLTGILGIAAVSTACGGESESSGAAGAGAAKGSGGATGGSSANPGTGGSAASNANGSSTPGPQFNGGGDAYLPLTPGCGPSTASECTGACEARATTDPGSIIRAPATLCFSGAEDPTPADPLATIEQVIETIGGQRMIHLRVTFDPAFVDNTYGANACCGWPGTGDDAGTEPAPEMPAMPGGMPGMPKPPKMGKGGHTFNDLVGSDHLELLLTDGAANTVMDFKLDYITADASAACGYRTLGVSGGEGKMILGDAAAVLGVSTSIDRDLNGCGYCYTTDSPATDASYTPNPSTPDWDYRVVYEVWLALDAFGSAGFGQAYITNVHASPSKLDNNTVEVTATPCPGEWDTPMGGACQPNYTVYIQSEGKSSCVPIPFANYPNMKPCPDGYELDALTEGRYCLPI
jgi:hypothetical protein